MNLRILWMYHDLMDLYGDRGNIQVLKMRGQARAITVSVDTCTIGEAKDPNAYDLIFLGGGADREQDLLHEDLLARRADLACALRDRTAFLLICGGYQLFGRYYKDQDQKEIQGLSFFPYWTEATDRAHRCIGNIAVEATIDRQTFNVIGFENHGGQTRDVPTPFGKVLYGNGNVFAGKEEGFIDEQVIGTYMHGPLLPKNPQLADLVLRRALKKRHGDVELTPLDDTLETTAASRMFRRLHIRRSENAK